MGHLDDGGCEVVVAGGQVENVATAEGGTPTDHPGGVDVVQAAGVGDGGPPVSVLFGDVKDAAGLSFAGTPVSVVEYQGGVAGLGESCGVGVQAQFAEGGKPVGQYDDGRVLDTIGPVQPRGTRVPSDIKVTSCRT